MVVVLRRLRNRSLCGLLVLVVSLWLAYLLSFDSAISADSVRSALVISPFVVLLQLGAIRHFASAARLSGYDQ